MLKTRVSTVAFSASLQQFAGQPSKIAQRTFSILGFVSHCMFGLKFRAAAKSNGAHVDIPQPVSLYCIYQEIQEMLCSYCLQMHQRMQEHVRESISCLCCKISRVSAMACTLSTHLLHIRLPVCQERLVSDID